MILKINTSYMMFHSAINMLRKSGIELNIIKNYSPFVVASENNPDVVIHPMSNIMKDEFPTIKFCGPNCKFPNYDFTPQIGFTDFNFSEIKTGENCPEIVLINTVGDLAFIKFLESIGLRLAIYGRPCDSIYYYGDVDRDTYSMYKGAVISAVDSEAEMLKAIRVQIDNKNRVISNFNHPLCDNFKNKELPKTISLKDAKEVLDSKNWNVIFKELFNKIGIKINE